MLALAVAGLLVVPPAIAWACNPQAHLNLGQTSVTPGSQVTVYGSYFPSASSVTVTDPNGVAKSESTGAGGAFKTTVTAPTKPGNYVISASKPSGGSAPASFSVVAPEVANSTPVSGTSGAGAPSQPATSPTPSDGSAAPAFVVPNVQRSPVSTGSVAPKTAPQIVPAPAPAPAPPVSSGVVSQGGQQVFAGSIAQNPVASTPIIASTPVVATTAPKSHNAAPARGQAGAATSVPSASQLTASSDLWSGFAPGQTASLTSAGDGGMSGGGTSSALTIGIGALALGLVGLVAGLMGAELRRRSAISGR
jgi:hypothetical protein